jgi:hypothetical protein
LSAICAVLQGTEPNFEARRLRDVAGTRQCRLSGQLLLREPLNPTERLMSKIERSHLLSREPLNAMSEGENAKTARVLRESYRRILVTGGVRRQRLEFAV